MISISRGPGVKVRDEGLLRSLTGSRAVAEAMRQTNPEVVAAYPITPSTPMVEIFSQMVADGDVDTEFVTVESEHSAMSACIGAASAGVRAQTVTSSQGLALMWEMINVAAGLRLHIVLHAANRTLAAPINIHCDHSDTMGIRDSGWIQLFGEDPQEAYDHALISVRVAEHPDVLLPTLHTQDGYTVTHNVERVALLPDVVARAFLGEHRPAWSLLDTQHPHSLGAIAGPNYFFELKRQAAEAMSRALKVIPAIFEEYASVSGRSYHLVETESLEDADLALVMLGSSAGTALEVVRDLRGQGLRVGLLKVRCFRPFPVREVAAALRGRAAVGVMDRSLSPGAPGGPVFQDVLSSLYAEQERPAVVGYTYGLGGRELRPQQVVGVFRDLARVAEYGQEAQQLRYVGLRE